MRRLILPILLLAAAPVAAASVLAPAKDLDALGSTTEAKDKVILVFFYQEQCHYCETVRKQFLRPISGNPDYEQRLVIRKVDIRGLKSMRGFGGEKLSHKAFADRQKVGLTPTVAFFGPEGRELAESIVGLKGGHSYYGHYLDKGIDAAEQALTASGG